jgi:hypothetical protein
MVIVPNELRDEINRYLDRAYVDAPEAAVDREKHYAIMLDYFDKHGALPPSISFRKILGACK